MTVVGRLTVRCATPLATEALGRVVASVVEPGDVVILTGELGAGKTTFVKGVVAALGGTESVTSPTFVLCHLYDTEPVVAHIDCWRFESSEEVMDLSLSEILDSGGIAFMEWGDIAADDVGGSFLRMISIDAAPISDASVSDEEFFADAQVLARTISLEPTGSSWQVRMDRLQAALLNASTSSGIVEVVR